MAAANFLAVLGHLDRAGVGADQLDAVLVEDARAVEVHGDVERGLAPHRRQDRVDVLALDDLLDPLGRDRLDVGPVREIRVRHDRRRIGVHQDDPVPLLLERANGLGAGIVELAGLADDDRPRPQDENGF
jgi:hypothetical protein